MPTVQLFDSWSGSLAPDEFERLVIGPNARIVAALHERHPDTPVISFPKGPGRSSGYAQETGVQAVGVDETIDPEWAARELPAGMPVQGNFDPLLLLAEATGSSACAVHPRSLADRPRIFNLGHGIDRRTPIAHVERLLTTVRAFEGDAGMSDPYMDQRCRRRSHGLSVAQGRTHHLHGVLDGSLFMLPRQMIYLHPAAAGSPEDSGPSMGLLRKVILTPSLLVVWVLGLALAMTIGAWDQGWFHAKLLFVILLTASTASWWRGRRK